MKFLAGEIIGSSKHEVLTLWHALTYGSKEQNICHNQWKPSGINTRLSIVLYNMYIDNTRILLWFSSAKYYFCFMWIPVSSASSASGSIENFRAHMKHTRSTPEDSFYMTRQYEPHEANDFCWITWRTWTYLVCYIIFAYVGQIGEWAGYWWMTRLWGWLANRGHTQL